MSSLLHLSDPHFGTERPAVLEALYAWVRQHQPGVVVVSGDITQRARASQFRRARAFVDTLQECAPGCPVLVVPGNHDLPLFNLPGRLLDPYAGFRRAFGCLPETLHEDPQFHIQLLNTCSRWRHTDGELTHRQVARVVDRLPPLRPQQLRLVVTHQPAAVVRDVDVPDRLRGGEAALRSWSGRGVDMVLGGHIHLPYLCQAERIWVVQAGTVVSRRIRAEADNSFNVIHPVEVAVAGARACLVERWDYTSSGTPTQAFGLHRKYRLNLPPTPEGASQGPSCRTGSSSTMP